VLRNVQTAAATYVMSEIGCSLTKTKSNQPAPPLAVRVHAWHSCLGARQHRRLQLPEIYPPVWGIATILSETGTPGPLSLLIHPCACLLCCTRARRARVAGDRRPATCSSSFPTARIDLSIICSPCSAMLPKASCSALQAPVVRSAQLRFILRKALGVLIALAPTTPSSAAIAVIRQQLICVWQGNR
jgi:hypothetical protein